MQKEKGFNLNGAMFQFLHCTGVKLVGKGTFFGSGSLYRPNGVHGSDGAIEKRPRMIMFYKASHIE